MHLRVLIEQLFLLIFFIFSQRNGELLFVQFFEKNSNNEFDSIIGNHAIGTVRKFPTLPLNANGVWIDPAGGVWRQASTVTKDGIPDYAQVSSTAPTLPLPDYER